MVWAIVDPSGLGDFSPEGDYVGWNESLTAYFNDTMSAESRDRHKNWPVSYTSYVAARFSGESSDMPGATTPIPPLQPHEWPTEFRSKKTHVRLGALIKLPSQLLCVSQPIKELIERLEPGCHRFSPIKITMPRGVEYPVPYYAMIIGRFLASFDPDRSDSECYRTSELSYGEGKVLVTHHVRWDERKYYSGLVLSRQVFDTAHLWRERHLLTPRVFLSDTLAAGIAELGLRMPKIYKLKDV